MTKIESLKFCKLQGLRYCCFLALGYWLQLQPLIKFRKYPNLSPRVMNEKNKGALLSWKVEVSKVPLFLITGFFLVFTTARSIQIQKMFEFSRLPQACTELGNVTVCKSNYFSCLKDNHIPAKLCIRKHCCIKLQQRYLACFLGYNQSH